MVKRVRVLNETEEERTSIYSWLPSILPGTMNYKEYWTGYKNFVVKPDRRIVLVEIPVDTSKQEERKERQAIRAILRQLTVLIEYEDLYGNAMKPKNMRLFHFGRTDNEN